MYASDLEAYAGSGGGEAAPISLAGFREVSEISSEVIKLCANDGRTATSLVSILQILGKHLLKVGLLLVLTPIVLRDGMTCKPMQLHICVATT